MRLASDSKLYQLALQQYREGNGMLSLRLARWKYALDCWRGFYREEGFYDGLSYESFYGAAGLFPDDDVLYDQDLRYYVLELFKHTETFLTRLDRAFTANPRPFALAPPKIAVGAMPPGDYAQRRAALDGVTAWLCHDYRTHGFAEQQIMALRDALLCEIGYTLSRRSQDVTVYPRAEIERLPPWDVIPDPLARTVKAGRYVIVRHPFSLGAAIEMWPDAKSDLRAHAEFLANTVSVGEPGDVQQTSEGRREIRVLHFFGWYDPEALQGAMPDDELQDLGGKKRLMELWFLANKEGEPSNVLLDAYPLPFGFEEIPIQEYVIIRDPEERGPFGRSFASLVMDGNEALNVLFNRSIQAFEYATLQGGFFDIGFAGALQPALTTTPRPGEWKGIPLAAGDFAKALMPLKYPDHSRSYLEMLDQIRRETSRYSAINDSNVGLSAPTQTNTLGEVTLLQNESNETFRFRAQRLDWAFRRSYELHARVSADVLRSWYTENPGQGVFFYDPESSMYIPLDPSLFDEPWEIELQAGSTMVDGPRRAQVMIQMAGQAAQAGLPVQTDRVFRKALTLMGEDAETVLGTPQEVQAQMAQAQMAQMAMAGMQWPSQGGVIDPGLATDAAKVGQGVML